MTCIACNCTILLNAVAFAVAFVSWVSFFCLVIVFCIAKINWEERREERKTSMHGKNRFFIYLIFSFFFYYILMSGVDSGRKGLYLEEILNAC
jgi:hypothetical protein